MSTEKETTTLKEMYGYDIPREAAYRNEDPTKKAASYHPMMEVKATDTNPALNFTQTIMSGEVPSNKQIHQVLDTTKEFIKEKQEEAPTSQTRKVLRDAAEMVEATQQVIDNKNKDENLQKLAAEGVKTVVETGKVQIHAISKDNAQDVTDKAKQAGEAARRAGQASLSVVKMMLTNGEFRSWFLDFAGFMHDALFQAYQKAEDQSKFQGKENWQQQQPQQQPQQQQQQQMMSATPSQFSGEWTEELKQKLAERFMSLLDKLNSYPDFAAGARDLFDALDALKEKAKQTSEELKEHLWEDEQHEEVQLALDHARVLVERFSGRKLDTLINSLDRFVNHLRERKDLDQWLTDTRCLFECAAKDPQRIGGPTQLRQRVQNLIDSADRIRHEISEQNDFRILVDESKAIFERIKNDPDVKRFNEKAAKFFENFTYIDPSGKRCINRDLIAELRLYVVPLLMKQLEEIPIPPFQDHNEDYDYRIENLVLSGSDIIPERVKIYIDSEFEFNVAHLETEKGCTTALLKVTDIKTKIPGVRFWINKKTFPSIEDAGVANISLVRRGAILNIYLKIENLFTEKPTFVFSRAQFTIDALNINIVETKHNIVTPILTSLWKSKIKHTIEEQAMKKITEIAKSMEVGLNGLLSKYPPARLAQYATDTISMAGEKIVEGVKNISEVASSKLSSAKEEASSKQLSSDQTWSDSLKFTTTTPIEEEPSIKNASENLEQKLFGKMGHHDESQTTAKPYSTSA